MYFTLNIGVAIKDLLFGAGEAVVDVLSNVVDAFFASMDALYTFCMMLLEQQVVMDDMIEQIHTGTFEGVNLITIIGGYRYLVGDVLFTYTYLILMAGSGFMIYKLVLYIYHLFVRIYENSKISKLLPF